MKVSKRDFVKRAAATAVVVAAAARAATTGTGVAASQAAPMTATGGDTWTAQARPFDLIVFNDLFPQARAFAASLSEQGARALPIAGDAGRLWYERLRGLIANGHRRIAGLTTHTDLFILETLAREKGLRVSQRQSAGRLVSWVLL
jgi:hypothetical protein